MKFADSVRHLYLPELNSISKIPKEGLRFWLGNSNNFILKNNSSDHFEITFYDIKEILSYYASDINRLSCAALETIFQIKENTEKKSIAWNLIQYYYAGFYSAHSIIKILGFGLVSLDDRVIQNLQKNMLAYNTANISLSRGIYCLNIDKNKKIARFDKIAKYNDSHKGLWARFADLLKILNGELVIEDIDKPKLIPFHEASISLPLSIYAQVPQNDAQHLIERIDFLLDEMHSCGGFNYFSFIRNKINYNHSYGVWYPNKDYDRKYNIISSMNSWCFKDPMDDVFNLRRDQNLVSFVKYLQFISSINFCILNDIYIRNPDNRSFLKNNFMAYKNKYFR